MRNSPKPISVLDKTAFGGVCCTKHKSANRRRGQVDGALVLKESRRCWKGGRSKPVEWTAEGGLNGEQVPSLCSDGLFPRYQGKARVGAPPSGRFETANLGGTAEVLRLLSQRYLQQVFSWDGGLFLTLRPGIGRHFERGGRHALSSII